MQRGDAVETIGRYVKDERLIRNHHARHRFYSARLLSAAHYIALHHTPRLLDNCDRFRKSDARSPLYLIVRVFAVLVFTDGRHRRKDRERVQSESRQDRQGPDIAHVPVWLGRRDVARRVRAAQEVEEGRSKGTPLPHAHANRLFARGSHKIAGC